MSDRRLIDLFGYIQYFAGGLEFVATHPYHSTNFLHLVGELAMYRVHDQKQELYTDGPFVGRRKEHPYHTVLSRLHRMGVSPLERQFGESDHAYVERMDRSFAGLFSDILREGLLSNKP